jgi:GTP1/Obg family GTP-binding protein
MHRFFEKYVAYFKDKDAIKLMCKTIHNAKKMAEEDNPKYLEELKLVHDIIQDFLELKTIK